MRIAPIGLQNNYSNYKSKANTSFGMELSPTGHIAIKMARAEGKMGMNVYNALKNLHITKPDSATLTDDIVLGLEKFNGEDGPLVATIVTKDGSHFKSQKFSPNDFPAAYDWAINPKTIKELRAQ